MKDEALASLAVIDDIGQGQPPGTGEFLDLNDDGTPANFAAWSDKLRSSYNELRTLVTIT